MIIHENYQILKTQYLIYKRKLEERYIVPLNHIQIICIITLITAMLGISVRIYYNGIFGYLQNMFCWSWLGWGWGKTPPLAALVCFIVSIIISSKLFIVLHNIQRVHAGMDAIRDTDLIFEAVRDAKHKFNECFYKRSYKWD